MSAASEDRLTVGDLAGMEQFGCRVLGGSSGLGRPLGTTAAFVAAGLGLLAFYGIPLMY